MCMCTVKIKCVCVFCQTKNNNEVMYNSFVNLRKNINPFVKLFFEVELQSIFLYATLFLSRLNSK